MDLRKLTAGNGRTGGASPPAHGSRSHRARRPVMLASLAVLLAAPAATAFGSTGAGAGKATAVPASSAEQQIRENWTKFFDPGTPVQEKEQLLENGTQLAPALKAFSGDKLARQLSAQVSQVSLSSPTEAQVRYSLSVQGRTALPDATGTAVKQNNVWKVSDSTLCSLVQLAGGPKPAGC
ncbi:hypothetical protein [Streptomyces sp. NPDC058045]|uniref:hypothetical protein n=1 Tax=Streptomyces sp. NPDC058045 TaxID=3346311 RepID=UPI0036E882BB